MATTKYCLTACDMKSTAIKHKKLNVVLIKNNLKMEAPKLNEIWQIQWGEAVGKEHNALVRIDEDKKELNPPNWRCNQYKCEHKGSELIVGGDRFIERWAAANM